ncbi:hypothetical protein [Desulfosoma sp.]|uniref:hypothetical protein n=1 Tax=Desulfosoma sp. TaxID=2603217 RepID=UPI0040499229
MQALKTTGSGLVQFFGKKPLCLVWNMLQKITGEVLIDALTLSDYKIGLQKRRQAAL